MRLLGFFLLFAGWLLVIAAIVLLSRAGPRAVFVVAGMAVEVAGFGLLAHSHLQLRGGA
jgi:hypothetical protein